MECKHKVYNNQSISKALDVEKADGKWCKQKWIEGYLFHACQECPRVRSSGLAHSALKQQNTTDIEIVQKCALSIILSKDYGDYENALIYYKLKSKKKEKKLHTLHEIC